MIGRYWRELSVAVAYAVLLAVLAVAAPAFFAPDQLLNVLVSNAALLTAAVGMTMVILARQIDISIGSQACICGVVAGLLAQAVLPILLVAGGALLAGSGVAAPLLPFRGVATALLPFLCILLVAAGALLAGAAMGAVNGALVAGLKLPSIVVTLATFVIFKEGLRWLQEGAFVHAPPGFQWFGTTQTIGQWLVVGVAVVVFLAFAWGLRNLAVGRAIYATGSDEEAARLAGIRPNRVVFGVFVAMGALTGLAGLLAAVRFPQVDPNAGAGLELQAIAAVVVGGVAISGGRGNLVGALIGVALLGTIKPALEFLHTEAQWEKAAQGVIILAAVASDGLYRRGR